MHYIGYNTVNCIMYNGYLAILKIVHNNILYMCLRKYKVLEWVLCYVHVYSVFLEYLICLRGSVVDGSDTKGF